MGYVMRGDQDLLYVKIGTTQTRVPGITNFSENQPAKSQIDNNDFYTPKGTTASLSGRPGGQHQLTYNINYDPTNVTHQALKAASVDGTIFEWTQVFRADDGTADAVWTYTGEIANLPISGQDNALITTTLTINCEATPNYEATLPSGIPADLSA